VETIRDSAALLHHHTNTDARERYAAHWREVTGLVVNVHRRHREDDSVERFLREFLVCAICSDGPLPVSTARPEIIISSPTVPVARLCYRMRKVSLGRAGT
jgi:hypothetical protein